MNALSIWHKEPVVFLSLKLLQGGGVSFCNDKKGYILGVVKIGKSSNYVIKDVYYVSGWNYNFPSMSQICDKGYEVKFLPNCCTMTSLKSGNVILRSKRWKNLYVADLHSVPIVN